MTTALLASPSARLSSALASPAAAGANAWALPAGARAHAFEPNVAWFRDDSYNYKSDQEQRAAEHAQRIASFPKNKKNDNSQLTELGSSKAGWLVAVFRSCQQPADLAERTSNNSRELPTHS